MISTHVCYVAFGDILGDYSMAVVIGCIYGPVRMACT